MEDSTQILLSKAASKASQADEDRSEDEPHQPDSLTSHPTTDQTKDEELSQRLQDLSVIMLELLNQDNPSTSNHYISKYLADTYKSESSIIDSGIKAESRSSHLANVIEYRKSHPNYHIRVCNTTAHVNRETGRAMVWATTRTSGLPGLPDGATREGVTAIHWKKQTGGFWVLFRTTGIRGPGDHTASGF